MDILTQIYDTTEFFKESLFDSIGIHSIRYGRDGRGVPVGSSYAFMTPEDMARFGYLLLNDGKWGRHQILPPWWMKWALAPSEGYTAESTAVKPWQILKEGIMGNAVLWINRSVDGRWAYPDPITYKQIIVNRIENEFKKSPADMFFLAGHYGQVVAMVPSRKLVVVRTGRDKEYWSKIDQLMSSLVACTDSMGGN